MSTVFCALWLDKETAQRLGVSSGEPLSEMHLTLFMADANDSDVDQLIGSIRNYAAAEGTADCLCGETTGVGVFTDQTGVYGDAFYVSTSIAGLLEYRRALVQRAGLLANVWDTFEYNPHITVKYLNMGEELPYQRAPIVPLMFSEIVVRVTSGETKEDFMANKIEYHFPMTKSGDVVINL